MRNALCGLLIVVSAGVVDAQLPAVQSPAEPDKTSAEPEHKLRVDKSSKGRVPLNQEATVLVDMQAKMLIVESKVALREGLLEMLLCKSHTKEHESVLAFDGKAYILHAGLVALGIDPGKPVQFEPTYREPLGPKLKIELIWKGEDGKEHREDARSWVRHAIHRFFGEPLAALPPGLKIPEDSELRYDDVNKELSWYGPMTATERNRLLALSKDKKFQAAIQSFFKRSQSRSMDADWVFAGSAFVRDETEGRRVYLAESGDVICVANFPSAMIDVATRSSAEGQENLMFEAWTERIPPVGTPVRIEIIPVSKKPDEAPAKPSPANN